jgi:hypothetical protein
MTTGTFAPPWRWRRLAVAAALSGAVAFGGIYHWQAPQWAAFALLHPLRRLPPGIPSRAHDTLSLTVNGVTLAGWRFPAQGARRSTLVYLHGVGDNRAGSLGIAERFTRLGVDVVAYDSRAHGESTGEACTYGFFERDDLKAIVRGLPPQPVVLMGTRSARLSHSRRRPRRRSPPWSRQRLSATCGRSHASARRGS